MLRDWVLRFSTLMPPPGDPQHWKLSIFYYNPDDPRLFVRKQNGLAFTLNFAKPMAWAITGVTVIIAAAVASTNNAHFTR